jgi:ABC-type phosphate transport system substrate-binding protein
MKRRNFTGSRTPRSLAYFSRCRITTLVALAVLLNIMGAGVLEADAGASGAPLSGTGSSFAAPAISTWVNAVRNAPYSLSLSYANSNSGTGRYEFTTRRSTLP